MSDDLTSALDQIRERGYRNGVTGAALLARLSDSAAVDIPLLLAAVDKVLELTDSAKVTDTTICSCLDCTAARQNGFTSIHRLQPYMWNLDPAKVREAIARELGKVPDGG